MNLGRPSKKKKKRYTFHQNQEVSCFIQRKLDSSSSDQFFSHLEKEKTRFVEEDYGSLISF